MFEVLDLPMTSSARDRAPPGIGEVKLIVPKRFGDERGWFSEIYSARTFSALGIDLGFVQVNHSFSAAVGTLRGLHLQRPPHGQAKLVRCTRGRIFDVVVDVRRGARTYGEWFGTELSAANGRQLFIPVGFLHGFLTLDADSEVIYAVSDFYAPQCEDGVRWDDPVFAIDWPLPPGVTPSLSAKDKVQPLFAHFESPFV
jgi:dTDP-4-dehydrorhamnose 3,5-epimerase